MNNPTLEQIASLKLRLRTLPDELNVAREAAVRLGAEVKDAKTSLAEQEAEFAAFHRAEMLADAKGKRLTDAVLTAGIKAAVAGDITLKSAREAVREIELRRDGAELQVKHLTDRFMGLQTYSDLTCAEVRLLVAGLGA